MGDIGRPMARFIKTKQSEESGGVRSDFDVQVVVLSKFGWNHENSCTDMLVIPPRFQNR